MNIVKDENGVITIDGVWRIERTIPRREAIATKELLSDKKTASYYRVGGRDARNRVIVLGQPMEYLDRLSTEVVFGIYRERAIAKGAIDPTTGKPSPVDHKRFLPVGTAPDEMAAISRVSELMAEKAEG